MTRSGHLHKADRWLHSQLSSHPAFVSVMARSKKALPVVGKTSKILKAETWSVEKSFSETQEELDWEEHLIPRQKNPHIERAQKQQIPGMVSARARKITQPLNSSLVSRWESKGWIVLAEVPLVKLCPYPGRRSPALPNVMQPAVPIASEDDGTVPQAYPACWIHSCELIYHH